MSAAPFSDSPARVNCCKKVTQPAIPRRLWGLRGRHVALGSRDALRSLGYGPLHILPEDRIVVVTWSARYPGSSHLTAAARSPPVTERHFGDGLGLRVVGLSDAAELIDEIAL